MSITYKSNVKSNNRKRATESVAARSLSAYALLWDGTPAGRIVIYYTESTATATIVMHSGPLAELPIVTAKASGYGYCKASAACDSALRSAITSELPDMSGAGMSTVQVWFKKLGYEVFKVV